MKVRKARPADIHAIEWMAGRFLDETVYGQHVTRTEALDRVRNLALMAMQEGLALVLVHEGGHGQAAVGMLGAVPLIFPLTGEPYGEELIWWVEPGFRGGSGAYRMLRWFEEWARQSGLRLVKMVGPADDGQLRAVLERLGYVAVETTFLKRF